jgi:p21-activated kinase 1
MSARPTMDSQQQQKGGRRLTKKREHAPPPVAYLNSGHNPTSTLKRSPSDASYFNHHGQQQQQHSQYQYQQQGGLGLGISQRGPSPGASATTASPLLRRSPSLLTPVHEQLHPAGGHYTAQAASFAHLPPASVGAPFNATAVEQALYASGGSSGGAAGTRRPSPPQHSYTYSPDYQPAKFKAPTLRQSASFTALARKMETPPSGTKSPRSNRYSDEGDGAKKRLSGGGKKKGAFSSFMSNLVSSPRRPTISTPTNPMHVTHVSIDNETGEYTVRGPLAR